MSLFIRDEDVDALARRVQKAINARSKTEAVRIALQNELDRVRQSIPLKNRIRKYQDMAKAMGPDDPNLDLKQYMDEMWGDV